MARVKGEAWARYLQTCLRGDDPPAKFELKERTADGFNTISPFGLPEDADDELIWRRVGELCATAQDDTNHSDIGRRAYLIVAIDANGEVLGRSNQIRFHTEKESLNDGEGSELEGPNTKGVVSQMMRHSEAMVRLMLQTAQGQIQSMSQLTTQLLKEKSEVESRRLDLMVQLEELLSNRHARDLEFKKVENQERRMEAVFGQVQRVMPALIARLTPAGAIQSDATSQALASSVRGLVEGLPADRLNVILEALGPEKAASLGEVLTLVEQIQPPQKEGSRA